MGRKHLWLVKERAKILIIFYYVGCSDTQIIHFKMQALKMFEIQSVLGEWKKMKRYSVTRKTLKDPWCLQK